MTSILELYLDFHYDGENLISLNAKEGNKENVRALIAMDAQAEKDAAYGFAWGGHDKEVDRLIQKDDHLIPFAAAGYARAGRDDKVNQLRNHNDEAKKGAVFGYAQAGNTLQVDSALRSRPLMYRYKAVLGAASTNQRDLLFHVLEPQYYGDAIKMAAQHGQFDLVSELFSKMHIDDKKPLVLAHNETDSKTLLQLKFLNKALSGFIHGCHFYAANYLMNVGADPCNAISELSARKGGIQEQQAWILLAHINDSRVRQNALTQILEKNTHIQAPRINLEHIQKINTLIQEQHSYLRAYNEVVPIAEQKLPHCSKNINLQHLNDLAFKDISASFVALSI